MTEHTLNYPLLIMILGGIIILTMLVRAGLTRLNIPALVGFLVLGFLMKLADMRWGILTPGSSDIFGFLAKLGLISLLFRVGLESNLAGLLNQLKRASLIWSSDVLVSGLIGFITAFYLLHLAWITSLIVAAAFTATSVGISVAIWDDAGALNSKNGEMLIDVAELDDISAVVLMALLFSLLPVLTDKTGGPLMPVVARTLGVFLAKLIGFGVCCYLFSRYAEKPITARFKNMNPPSSYMLVVLAIGFIIAAAADMLGFSMAIGAFFAGLVFSRDPEAVKRETSFMPLYELFSPFFFIGIGMSMDPESLHGAAGLGAILLLAAMISKMLADGLPAWMMGTFSSGALIGISMIPRAEIAMVIMHRGLYLKNQAVSAEVFGAMVMVSLGTCLIAPLCVKPLLQKWPQPEEK